MRAHLFVLFACLAVAFAGDFSSASYQGQSAQQKMSKLWKEINADTTPYGWYSALSLGGLFFSAMKPTFDHVSDTMPEGRKKLIHAVGSVVQAEFVPAAGSPYTGMFKGVSEALIRVSLAKQPNPKSKPEGNFAPGFAIKLLRDSMPSANIVAMYSVEGQSTWNIFQNDWTHHIHGACSFALKVLERKFSEATQFIARVGLKDWAKYDQKGRLILASEMKIPFQLVFRPTSAVKNRFPESYQDEFTKQLASIPAGTALWDVYALEKPHAQAVKIGTFKSKSKFTTSKFGDKDLFFQHSYSEDDIEVHPEWKAAIAVNPAPISFKEL